MRVPRLAPFLAELPKSLWRRHRWSLPLSVGSAFFFARLAGEMREGEVDGFDRAVQHVVGGWRGHLDGLMFAFTASGDILPMSVLAAGSIGFLLARGQRREAAYVLAGSGGSLLLNQLLKMLFRRARPGEDLLFFLQSPSSSSFPSGHTMGTTAVIACLIVVLRVGPAPRAVKGAAIAVGSAFIAGVGLSRIYFGVHYPSDVVAGFLGAAAWVSAITGSLYPHALPGEAAAPSPGSPNVV